MALKKHLPGVQRFCVILFPLALLMGACSSDGDEDASSGDLRVIATTTVLGDLARNVVGEDARVEVLIPTGADPHDYRLTSQQVAAIDDADLVVANGLGLEAGLADVLDNANDEGVMVLGLGPMLDPIPFAASKKLCRPEQSTLADSGGCDPHVWLDPIRMATAAQLIATELESIHPVVDWGARASAYATELEKLDSEIQALMGDVPAENRKLVTNHDALGYFASRYGFEVIGTVIPGGSTLADPSSDQLTSLVRIIQSEGVSAIFAETTESDALARAVAEELGGTVEVVELYTGSLGEQGSRAESLIGMLRENAQRISEVLK